MFLLIFIQAINAQNKPINYYGLIIGNILEENSLKSISDATVLLISNNDSIQKFKRITDKNGSFEFDKIPLGFYKLVISHVSFKMQIIDSIHLRQERYDFNLGDIKLNNSNTELQDVIIYSEKPLIENKDGKLTYNVGESALSAGSTTAELLKNMPLIQNDPNGKILLKGKEPKILIDDKPTDLTAQQLNDLLESLPGSSIEKIEIMTNPPPQYATESGGVINIVTKKGKVGFVGRLNSNAGTRGDGNLSTNLSYRNKKIVLTANIGFGFNKITGYNYSVRTNYYADSSNQFKTDGNYLNKNTRPNIRLQFDYEFSKFSNMSLVAQSNLNLYNNASFIEFKNFNKLGEIYRLSQRNIRTKGDGVNHNFSYSYTHKGKNVQEKLQFIATVNLNKNENDRTFYQQFLNSNFTFNGVDSTQIQNTNNSNNSFNLRVNYDLPIGKSKILFQTGTSYSNNLFHNTLGTSFYNRLLQQMVENNLLSNDFKFNQNFFTTRAGFFFQFEKGWKLTTSAQLEQTILRFNFYKDSSNNVSNTYWNLLPSITLRKEFNKYLNTSLIYRATIRRPGIGELNPSIDYNDPYNIRFGNPYLEPQLADNFDLNISLVKGKWNLNSSIGFNNLKDVFNIIRTLVDAGKTEVTWQNISNRKEYEISLWGGYTFSKKFRMNIGTSYSFNQYNELEKVLYKYRDGGSYNANVNYNYMPNPLTTIEGNIRYNNFADPQGRGRSNLTFNFGIQRKFFQKRLNISFNIIDPFQAQQFTSFTYGKNFLLENFNASVTKNYKIGISYQLNKVVQKPISSKKKKV